MSDRAEYFMESLYFPTGDGETALVDVIDETMYIGCIEQPLCDVVDDMMFNTRYEELCESQIRMVELCNQYRLGCFADYAKYCTLKNGPDKAEYEILATFCRLCNKYKPDPPAMPTHNPGEAYRYLEDMLKIVSKFDEMDEFDEASATPRPYIRVETTMRHAGYMWELSIKISCGGEQCLDSFAIAILEPELSADEVVLKFNRTLLDSSYKMLAIKWGDWGKRDET